jgi:hypothetical protein
MNSFSIRDIENLCRIKAHTLRIWEQRYGLPLAKRNSGNHRFYDADDLKHFLRIAFLYHRGHRISTIAGLEPDELLKLAKKLLPNDSSGDYYITQLTEASLDFDEDRFVSILDTVIIRYGIEKVIPDLIWKYLEFIGLLWLTGNVVPAQEHFASTIIINKMYCAIQALPAPELDANSVYLLFTPENEFHEMPVLYMQYLLKKYGCRTVNFGKHTPLEEMETYCVSRPVTHLYFHLVTFLLKMDINTYVEILLKKFPGKKIAFSGSITSYVTVHSPDLFLLRNHEELVSFAREQHR